jgi:hypothetical protein
MIGKQINFYLTAADRLQLMKAIQSKLGCIIVKRTDAQPYRACDQFDKEEDEWAIAYLCQHHHSNGVLDAVLSGHIDSSELLCIEFIQPTEIDSSIQRGRFWYTPKRLREQTLVPKPKDFVDWACAVFACAKHELSPHGNGDWIGPEARSRLDSGEIRLST